MLTRLAAVLVLAVTCGCVWGQASVNFSGSLGALERFRVLVDVDHGSAPMDITLTVPFTTPSPGDFMVSVEDLDMFLDQVAVSGDFTMVSGPGSDSLVLTLPARTGVHQVLLEVLYIGGAAAVTFSGSVDASAGSVSEFGSHASPVMQTGASVALGRLLDYRHFSFSAPGTFRFDFALDFGPTAHPTTFAMTLEHYQDTSIRLLDMTTSPPVELASWPAQPFGTTQDIWVTTAAHAGIASFRVEFVVHSGSASLWASGVLGADVSVGSVASSSVVQPASGSSGGGGSCTTGKGAWIPALLPMLAVLVRRRRRAVACGV